MQIFWYNLSTHSWFLSFIPKQRWSLVWICMEVRYSRQSYYLLNSWCCTFMNLYKQVVGWMPGIHSLSRIREVKYAQRAILNMYGTLCWILTYYSLAGGWWAQVVWSCGIIHKSDGRPCTQVVEQQMMHASVETTTQNSFCIQMKMIGNDVSML